MLTKKEKEMLLQLLVEKAQSNETPKSINKSMSMRKRNLGRHSWTNQEKQMLLAWHNEGINVVEMARRLNVRRSQAENMLYSMLNRVGA